MKLRFVSLTLLVALLSAFSLAPMRAAAATKEKNAKHILKNLHVSGTLADGRSFDGKLTVTQVGYDTVEGLTISGELKGQATKATGKGVEHIKQSFSTVAATLSEQASASELQAQATCDILFLDLGPIFLDVLGLTVDLSRVILDINAVSGAGNLVGNLLCGILGLLDPATGLLRLLEDLGRLFEFLDGLNDLLG